MGKWVKETGVVSPGDLVTCRRQDVEALQAEIDQLKKERDAALQGQMEATQSNLEAREKWAGCRALLARRLEEQLRLFIQKTEADK